ncbi:hypothetical protein ABIE12_001034 [Serratia sp. 509]
MFVECALKNAIQISSMLIESAPIYSDSKSITVNLTTFLICRSETRE